MEHHGNNNLAYGFDVASGNTNCGGNHASGSGVADCTGDATFCAGGDALARVGPRGGPIQ
jgi:hypothetical protein